VHFAEHSSLERGTNLHQVVPSEGLRAQEKGTRDFEGDFW